VKDTLDDNLAWFDRVKDHVGLVPKAEKSGFQVLSGSAQARNVCEILERMAQVRHVRFGLSEAKGGQ